MSLIVIHPFGAYQPGDVIPEADAAAILASEAAANVVPSHPTASAPEPEHVAVPLADVPFVTVSASDPS
ncbi:MAG: hypothetical protein KGL35_08380 [Bradyrhizobium sp.]|nr:hypothetical protein [Bradyrhizobium sp.]